MLFKRASPFLQYGVSGRPMTTGEADIWFALIRLKNQVVPIPLVERGVLEIWMVGLGRSDGDLIDNCKLEGEG